MKKLSILFLFIFSNIYGDAQNITGTWQGYFTSNHVVGRTGLGFTTKYYFTLELKQSYKAVWGAYNTTDSSNLSVGCFCKVSGILPKKQTSIFELYNEGVINHDPKISVGVCEALNRLFFHYVTIDNNEYLIGKWFTGENASVLNNGSSGTFILQHVSVTNKNNVDQYFPKLDKLLNKGTTTDTLALKTAPLIIDPASSLNIEEKEIINAIMGKKNN